ncbi:DUF2157 domain-containing protein [Nocardiopsis sp. RSe5-2]|uniref:DUF2157 domain-containing protein n=1 Tax=Nocardiopsis endophytica TaxID=3018445 RepID=A0ABT4U852_9ACTN|nr:DUF2157 domain-containing protein [Nocardiopsis endophytica]MDA2813134.1 DUF2157 domain-containing protein [Nocardiopsis endophytica]
MSDDARRAREAALGRLVEQGVITAGQAQAVSSELDRAQAAAGVRWSEVVGYIGGGLLLAAVATFAATSWEDLGDAVRVALLAAAVPVLALAGMAMAGGPRAMAVPRDRLPKVKRRVGGTLFALASVAALAAVQVFFSSMLPLWEDPLLVAGGVGLAVAAGGYVLVRSAPGVVAAWAMSTVLVAGVLRRLLEAMGLSGGILFAGQEEMAVNGTGYILLGAVWIAAALSGLVVERGTAVGLGAGTALAAAEVLPTPWSYLGVLGLAVAFFGLYAWRRAGVLLVFGTIAATIGVPQMVWELTDGQVSAAAILAIAGAVLLGVSWAGVRLHRSARPGDGGGDGAQPANGVPPEGPHHNGAPGPASDIEGGPTGGEGDRPTGQDQAPQHPPAPRIDPRDPDERL